MGLDMYAYTCKATDIGDKQVDIEINSDSTEFDRGFDYWRKFNHLHGWMEQLYIKKGGSSQEFNCNTVRLMPEDLDVLESMAKLKSLAPTGGFFFGDQDPFNDSDRDAVLEFIKKSRAAIADGKAVIYDSWW